MTSPPRLALTLALALALAALAACDRPTPLPDMGLSSSAVLFEAPAAAGDPAGQSVYVVNSGEGSLAAPTASVAYQDAAGWLTATVEGASAPYRVLLQARVGSLGPGHYRATVTLAAANASSSPLQVAATLDVPEPRFAVSASELRFDAARGGDNPPAQDLMVTNGGRGMLPVPQVSVSYVGPSGWLALVVGGTPASYTMSASADATGLAPGTYSATVTLTATGDAAPPQTLGVTLVVPYSEFLMHTAPIRIVAPADGSDPAPVDLPVSSLDGGPLPLLSAEIDDGGWTGPRWLTGQVLPWYSPDPSRQRVQLRVRPIPDPLGLQAGSYFATVLVSTPASTSPLPVRVELVIPPATIKLGPASVTLTRHAGCGVSRWNYVAAEAVGPAALPPLSATVDAAATSWLRATGWNTPGGYEKQLFLEVIATPPLGASATVTLTSPGVSPVVVTLPVTVVEMPAPPLAVTVTPARHDIRVQAGARDPLPTWVVSISPNTCLASAPRVSIEYPPGTDPWLGVEYGAWDGSNVVWFNLRPSSAGMSAGQTRTATLTFPDLVAAGATPVLVTLTVGGLSASGAMTVPRANHTLTAFDAGAALAVGGEGSLRSAEFYEASSGTWIATGDLATGRSDHGAVYVASVVLVCGGRDSGGAALRSCEFWSPYTNRWSPAATLVHARLKPVLVVDDLSHQVLVVDELSPPEVIDPLTWTATEVPAPDGGRGTATQYQSDVLVAGGSTSALYSSWYEGWYDQNPRPLNVSRARPALAKITNPILGDGNAVLALGGGPGVRSAEYYDRGRWFSTAPSGSSHDIAGTCRLWSGQAAAVAGYVGEESAAVELFDPITQSWSTPVSFPSPRAGTKVAVLFDGSVLFAGGTIAGAGATADTFTW